MTIGEHIYKIRMDLNLTQKEFADKIGTSQSAVNYWENGKRQPRIEQLQKIADALEVSVTQLMGQDVLNLTNDMIELFSGSTIESHPVEPDNPQESYLISNFRDLNDKGQKKATDYVEDLLRIPEYQKGPPAE